eukprot:scaffold18895_cov114-Skeletonema_marinoi.AAC.1
MDGTSSARKLWILITMPWMMQKKRFSPTQIKSIVSSATRKAGTTVFSCLVGWSRHTLHLVHNQRNGHQKMIGSSLILIWRGQSLRGSFTYVTTVDIKIDLLSNVIIVVDIALGIVCTALLSVDI